MLLLLASCASAPPAYVFDKEPQLGTTFPISRPSSEFWVTAAGQLRPSYAASFGGVRYVIAVDDTRRIRYIETRDPEFRTREGLHIGVTEADVLAAGGGAAIDEPGFGRYSRLQSGWSAYYGMSAEEDRVISFFKRQ